MRCMSDAPHFFVTFNVEMEKLALFELLIGC